MVSASSGSRRASATLRSLAIGVGFVFGLAGCAPRGASRPAEARVLDIRATPTAIDFDTMIEDLLEARAIYVGERHDSQADHRVELALAEGLFARDPSLSIGLEMFDREAQPALDAYVGGTIDEATFLERSDYANRWGFDYDLLRPTMVWARAHRVRVIALNAPRSITQAVARGGLAALSPEARASLPETLVLDDADHRAMILAALAEHPGLAPEQRERFYEAQVVWDETMGASVAAALAEGGARRIVVFAGAVHVRRGLGIPRTAARRGASPFRIVLPLGPEEAADEAALPAGERVADYLVEHAAEPGDDG